MAPKGAARQAAPQSGVSKGLRSSFHPAGTTTLQQVLGRIPGADASAQARAFVLALLDGPCADIQKFKGPAVKVNGRVNQNLHGTWVFAYDQRVGNSRWDEMMVLSRGLLVVISRRDLLAAGVPENSLQPGERLDQDANALLRGLCASDSGAAIRIFEPMPKFWEAGPSGGELSWEDISQACDGAEPRLVRIDEKVDGNLGMLYPQLDDDLQPLFECAPLLCTKGIAHSPDIERQLRMIAEHYPMMRLSPSVSHCVVEVVDLEMKVVTSYDKEHTGARLIAAHNGKLWLDQDTTDALSCAWNMPRPRSFPLPAEPTLGAVLQLASEYTPSPGEFVEEGFIAIMECPPLAETMRLKVHTHFWNVVHGWWEDCGRSHQRICINSVMPVLRDRRFFGKTAIIEPCLLKWKGSDRSGGRRLDDALVKKFRATVDKAECVLDACLAAFADTWARTAHLAKGKELKESLEGFLRTCDGPSKQQQQRGINLCVMRLRGDVSLGLSEAMEPQLVDRLPAILRRAFGALNSPDVCSGDADLVARLQDPTIQSCVRKLIEEFGSAAQSEWEKELAAMADSGAS
eukprot:TRINITY_DN11123_c0_g3_i1.p1 TRINITY_DN11123_c0_g3~~TRINITY_DN11123_c0_g3_i1.p1  ORF type:complete len:588 (-),score=61.30 TRINITY_DN11123_c0_g3_i1:353-2071(-)